MARSYDIERSRRRWRRGRRKAFVALLWIGLGCSLSSNAWAFDPLHPGLPACEGGEQGYWQTVTVKHDGQEYIHLALTVIDYLDPAYVICWVRPEQLLTVGERKSAQPTKQVPPVERSLHGLRQLYAHQR